jgi:hypothetical protein
VYSKDFAKYFTRKRQELEMPEIEDVSSQEEIMGIIQESYNADLHIQVKSIAESFSVR